ncbi:hypothetical protein, partial [Caldibacillus debilis]|uniref:hypothetical protein n=1 Tax=Caldibacillus debilis TaxID=301148 RepID=UPI0023F53B53
LCYDESEPWYSSCYVWVCVDFIITELPWLLYIYFVAFNFTMNHFFNGFVRSRDMARIKGDDRKGMRRKRQDGLFPVGSCGAFRYSGVYFVILLH